MWSCSWFPTGLRWSSGVDSCSFRFAAYGGDGGGALFKADDRLPTSLAWEMPRINANAVWVNEGRDYAVQGIHVYLSCKSNLDQVAREF